MGVENEWKITHFLTNEAKKSFFYDQVKEGPLSDCTDPMADVAWCNTAIVRHGE